MDMNADFKKSRRGVDMKIFRLLMVDDLTDCASEGGKVGGLLRCPSSRSVMVLMEIDNDNLEYLTVCVILLEIGRVKSYNDGLARDQAFPIPVDTLAPT
jgi:hypothetical protein